MSEALDIATTTNVQGERKTSIDRLIEIEYNENGELEMRFCQSVMERFPEVESCPQWKGLLCQG